MPCGSWEGSYLSRLYSAIHPWFVMPSKSSKSPVKSPAKAARKPEKASRPAAAASVKKSGKSPAKAAAVKPASKKPSPAKAAPAAKKADAKAPTVKKAAVKAPAAKTTTKPAPKSAAKAPEKAAPAKQPAAFLLKQRGRLLALKDTLLDSMSEVARDSLRSRAEGSEASAFGMHQADAGSDAYDRDFALSLLSQDQDALYEIEEALKRIDAGTYGTCEISGKAIPHMRLEVLPFTRYTVECQAELEKRNQFRRVRQPVTSLFGSNDDEGGDSDDDDSSPDSKD